MKTRPPGPTSPPTSPGPPPGPPCGSRGSRGLVKAVPPVRPAKRLGDTPGPAEHGREGGRTGVAQFRATWPKAGPAFLTDQVEGSAGQLLPPGAEAHFSTRPGKAARCLAGSPPGRPGGQPQGEAGSAMGVAYRACRRRSAGSGKPRERGRDAHLGQQQLRRQRLPGTNPAGSGQGLDQGPHEGRNLTAQDIRPGGAGGQIPTVQFDSLAEHHYLVLGPPGRFHTA